MARKFNPPFPDPLAGLNIHEPVKLSLHTGTPALPAEPKVWPACMKCGTAWALHRRLRDSPAAAGQLPSMSFRWIWIRECGHRSAAWELADENGPIDPI